MCSAAIRSASAGASERFFTRMIAPKFFQDSEAIFSRGQDFTCDVAAFVTDHFRESLHSAGLNIVDGAADVTISGELRQFFVTETSTYKGEVSVILHVKNSAGKDLWTGVVGGDSTRFGRSYKADNYYETVSDMVLRASYNLLSNQGFRDALQKH